MDDIHTIYIGLSGLVPKIYIYIRYARYEKNSERASDW